jgi:hypothetical protein
MCWTANWNGSLALGVQFTGEHRVEDLLVERDEGGFDAVFVAVGAHLSKRVESGCGPALGGL